MKNYMVIRQKVHDLGQFQKAFDEMAEHRRAAGLADLGQFRDAEDSLTAIVVMEVEDVDKAKEFWHSTVLARGRAAAGIVGPIEAGSDQVWLTDGLIRDHAKRPPRE